MPARLLDLPIDYEDLARAGSIMGSGGLVVMDEDTCMVDRRAVLPDVHADESCGKCTPCRVGTRQHALDPGSGSAPARGSRAGHRTARAARAGRSRPPRCAASARRRPIRSSPRSATSARNTRSTSTRSTAARRCVQDWWMLPAITRARPASRRSATSERSRRGSSRTPTSSFGSACRFPPCAARSAFTPARLAAAAASWTTLWRSAP